MARRKQHKARKNPEFFTDKKGVRHPIRGSYGWGGYYSREKAHEKPMSKRKAHPERRKIRRVTSRHGYRSLSH